MKTINYIRMIVLAIIIMALGISFSACGSGESDESESGNTKEIEELDFTFDDGQKDEIHGLKFKIPDGWGLIYDYDSSDRGRYEVQYGVYDPSDGKENIASTRGDEYTVTMFVVFADPITKEEFRTEYDDGGSFLYYGSGYPSVEVLEEYFNKVVDEKNYFDTFEDSLTYIYEDKEQPDIKMIATAFCVDGKEFVFGLYGYGVTEKNYKQLFDKVNQDESESAIEGIETEDFPTAVEVGTMIDEDNIEGRVVVHFKGGNTEKEATGWTVQNPSKITEGEHTYIIEYKGKTAEVVINGYSDKNKGKEGNNENQSNATSDKWTVVTDDSVKNICWSLAQDTVKANLKSPSTAKFPFSYGSDKVLIKENGKGMYEVTSRVTSENSFGAKVTTVFIVKIKDDNGTFKVQSCRFIE